MDFVLDEDIQTQKTFKFTCETCGRGFKRLDFFNKHTALHGTAPIEAPPKPPREKKPKTPKDETAKEEDEGEPKPKKEKKPRFADREPQKCGLCGKEFKRTDFYEKHMKSHANGEDP